MTPPSDPGGTIRINRRTGRVTIDRPDNGTGPPGGGPEESSSPDEEENLVTDPTPSGGGRPAGPDPYSRGAALYRERGHLGVVPCDKDGEGGTVEPGFTGDKHRDVYPTDEDVAGWVSTATLYPRNLALRLPEDGVGVDVDDPELFEEWSSRGGSLALPPLPPAWSSTSRGATADRRKFVYRAELPPGRRWRDFPGGEVVHHGYRYVRCWPSLAPSTGEVERWYGPDGRVCPDVPTAEELYAVELPPEWVEALSEPVGVVAPAVAVRATGSSGGAGARRDFFAEVRQHNADGWQQVRQRTLLVQYLGTLKHRHLTNEEVFELAWSLVSAMEQHVRGRADPWERETVAKVVAETMGTWPETHLPEPPGPGYDSFIETMRTWQPPHLLPLDGDDEVPEAVRARAEFHWADARGRALAAELELAEVRGERVKRTAREFAEVPQPEHVLTDVLAAEVNLLGGPQEAGKSLLAQEWALSVATGEPWRGLYGPPGGEVRNVLWVASEGLSDFEARWGRHPLWERAADRVYVLDVPVDLVRSGDVDWLLKEYAVERPGLVVLDVIYGMGMSDDNGVKDVLPVLSSMKRVSAEWGCATLALGHPGHNGGRRFRGSSMWRNLAYTDWHLDGGSLTCEKSKLADKRRLAATYRVEYPRLVWTSTAEALADRSGREAVLHHDFELHPDDTDSERARRLAPVLGLSDERVRHLVAAARRARG